MSFSSQVKEELLRIHPEKHCCMLSELSALTQACASLRLAGGGRLRVVYAVESAPLAKRIFLLLKKRLEITPVLEFSRQKRLGGRRVCLLTVGEADGRRLLLALRMLREGPEGAVYRGVPRAVTTRRCCRAAFVRGAFLGAGAVTAPEKGYHLEFRASDNRADTLLNILEKSGISASVAQRRGDEIVYMKRGDDVAACLALMGAHGALLEMENMRITRESRSQANRARNCDEANLKKQLSAAARQAEAIRAYSLAHSLAALPPELQEIGRARMLHPEASLEDLGQMLAPPLGKSGANHRMRKLMAALSAQTDDKDEEE